MGLDCPSPGNAACQAMFSPGVHFKGSDCTVVRAAPAPKKPGQFAPASAVTSVSARQRTIVICTFSPSLSHNKPYDHRPDRWRPGRSTFSLLHARRPIDDFDFGDFALVRSAADRHQAPLGVGQQTVEEPRVLQPRDLLPLAAIG